MAESPPQRPAPPPREEQAEDDYVRFWSGSGDVEGLMEAITDAVETRRPQLAARLVGLLPEDVETEQEPAIARARQAARFILVDDEAERNWSELEEAWTDLRRSRMKRIKRRMRKSLHGKTSRTPRLDKSRDRRNNR